MQEIELLSGYRQPYDPRPVLERMIQGESTALEELWENLHHQGDVDTASYFAVPALVAAGQLSLVAAIEVARHSPQNPDIPEKLASRYNDSLDNALRAVPSDQEQCLGQYTIHASVNGQPDLARALVLLEVGEILDTYGSDT